MAKSKEKPEPKSVEEIAAALADEQKQRQELEVQLAEALKKRADDADRSRKGPDGVKLTKKAPEGELGSDGRGNMIKYAPANNEKVLKQLLDEGWVKA
jgi:hypothetical protein